MAIFSDNPISDFLKGRPTIIKFIDPLTKDTAEFPIDVTMKIDTSIKAKVTSFPVEGSVANVSDHVQPTPLRLSLTGMISTSPTSLLLTVASSLAQKQLESAGKFSGLSKTFASAALAAGVSAAASLGGSASNTDATFAKLLTIRGEVDPDFPKKAMQGMIKMFRQGIPFTLRTYFAEEIYINMVMDSLSFPQSPKIGDSLMFSMSCTKIEIVKSSVSTTELQAADPANSSAADNEDNGGLTGKERDPIDAKSESMYKSITRQ